jgi:hypothetical protein
MLGQGDDVFGSFAERWNTNREHVELGEELWKNLFATPSGLE